MENVGSPNSEVVALRDAFGDGRPPEISRKITACVACRRQKIKCQMVDGSGPCTRCKKRSLPCTVNRSLQMLLEEDISWKQNVSQKLEILQQTVQKLTESRDAAQSALAARQYNTDDVASLIHPHVSGDEQAWEAAVDTKCEPASMPASCIAPVNGPSAVADKCTRNIVDKGLISDRDASKLFAIYSDRLDHLLYRILGDHGSLEDLLASSALLVAAVMTVGALHSADLSHLYEPCLEELKQLVTLESLSRNHSVDDVRGLCIGSFWIASLSWALSGAAVRIASEISLHHAIHDALGGHREAYLKTRLYYLVYVCDHHSSVLYGRPPMSRECGSVKAATQFLETDNATEDDVRLVTQVKIWSIYGEIFDCFGTNIHKSLLPCQLPLLRRFAISLDSWQADWRDRFGPNDRVGNYPGKGVGLHFYFAKLYLCCHAFRGLHRSPSPAVQPELEDVANTAVLSAMSILGIINSDDEIRSYINGLPLCFDMMITFSVVFLLKVATNYSCAVWIDKTRILNTVDQTVRHLDVIAKRLHDKHLLVSVAASLWSLADRSRQVAFAGDDTAAWQHQLPSPGTQHSQDGGQSEDSIRIFDTLETLDFYSILSEPDAWMGDLELKFSQTHGKSYTALH